MANTGRITRGEKPTLGKWAKHENNTGSYDIAAEDKDGYTYIGEIDRHFNADFICLCANQCQAVNKEHPEYVAERIGEMFEVCKYVAHSWNASIAEDAKEIIADIKRKE